jgi:hypothetical protein
MLEPLGELKQAELPQRKLSLWQLTGPGAVLVGLSIGAGEIVIWPRTVAMFGAGVVWAAVIGVLLQVWVNLEIARWTISTGETMYTGFARVWRGFAPLFILLNILGWLAPGWAMASGSALKALIGGPELGAGTFFGTATFWTMVTFGFVLLLLFGPKMIYNSVEKSIEIMVLTVTLGLILVAFVAGTADTWLELGRGVVNIGYKPPEMTVKALFIAIVFAGAGGTANLFYSFYLRDKNIGMGALVPDLENPLRGRRESTPGTGFTFADTPENVSRFRSWWRFIIYDQAIYFWLLNTFTLLLFIFGSLAVLRPANIVPEEGKLIWDESRVLGDVFARYAGGSGQWIGQKLFLIVGVATLFSTQLALVDGVARSLSDILYTNLTWARRRSVGWWYMVIALAWIVVGCLITYIMEVQAKKDLGVLLNAAYMGGFAMAVYVPLTLYMNLRFLPKSVRPGVLNIAMMVLATLVYTGFALACIWWELPWFKGRQP